MKNFQVLILLFCSFACVKKSPLDSFYQGLTDKVETNKLLKFRGAPKDSIIIYFQDFSTIFVEIYDDPAYEKDIVNFFGTYYDDYDEVTRALAIGIGFNYWLNGKNINSLFLLEETKTLHNRFREMKENKRKELEAQRLRIIKVNNENWEIGDTLFTLFPFDPKMHKNSYNLFYKNEPSLKYLPKNSILVKGILLDKIYQDFREEYSTRWF